LRDPLTKAVQRRYCLLPRTPVPAPDVLLAQYLTLLHDEQEFLRLAHAYPP
jgi:hypothetical protein